MKYNIDGLINRYPILASCKEDITNAYTILEKCYMNGNKLLVAGNGGSCSDGEHIVGELMKSFKLERKLNDSFIDKMISIEPITGKELGEKLQGVLPVIALDGHQSLNTAFINDVENGALFTFAQQILGYGDAGDVFLAITTSGNSKNLLYSCIVAKAKGMKIVALTGKDGGKIKQYADVSIIVPLSETFLIQEYHLPIYHCLCLMLEDKFFK